ncbi:Uncharacterised protein [Burkholderia pseudomallei]|nr:Uncharacterised protein [Burkholderia pseudomallei]
MPRCATSNADRRVHHVGLGPARSSLVTTSASPSSSRSTSLAKRGALPCGNGTRHELGDDTTRLDVKPSPKTRDEPADHTASMFDRQRSAIRVDLTFECPFECSSERLEVAFCDFGSHSHPTNFTAPHNQTSTAKYRYFFPAFAFACVARPFHRMLISVFTSQRHISAHTRMLPEVDRPSTPCFGEVCRRTNSLASWAGIAFSRLGNAERGPGQFPLAC